MFLWEPVCLLEGCTQRAGSEQWFNVGEEGAEVDEAISYLTVGGLGESTERSYWNMYSTIIFSLPFSDIRREIKSRREGA